MIRSKLLVLVGILASFLGVTSAAAQSNYTIRVCNDSNSHVLVAASYIPQGESSWLNVGWYQVDRFSCRIMGRTTNRNFYMYAEVLGDGSRFWGGSQNLCVEYPGPYRFRNTGTMRCNSRQTSVGFRALRANNFGTFTWRLTN